jgi:replicative DNA helicase
VPDNCAMAGIASRWEMINSQTPIDVTVIDYLQLLVPELRSRDSKVFEDQGGIVSAAARFKTTCNHGKGTPLISPWQINRAGQEKLRTSGGYELENMSATLAGGQSADVVLFLAAPEGDNSGGRLAPVELTIGKNRSGPKGLRLPLTADFATSSFWPRETGGDESLLDPIGGMP